MTTDQYITVQNPTTKHDQLQTINNTKNQISLSNNTTATTSSTSSTTVLQSDIAITSILNEMKQCEETIRNIDQQLINATKQRQQTQSKHNQRTENFQIKQIRCC